MQDTCTTESQAFQSMNHQTSVEFDAFVEALKLLKACREECCILSMLQECSQKEPAASKMDDLSNKLRAHFSGIQHLKAMKQQKWRPYSHRNDELCAPLLES